MIMFWLLRSCENREGGVCSQANIVLLNARDGRQQHNCLLYVSLGCIYYTTTPLEYYTSTLLHHYTITPLDHYTITPLHYYITTPL
jgi:hypothetical protein